MDSKQLLTALNNSGVQQQNNALYQVIQNLITSVQELQTDVDNQNESDAQPNPIPSTQIIPIGITPRSSGSVVTCLKNLPAAAANTAGTLTKAFELLIPGGTFTSNTIGGDHIQWMFQGFFAGNMNTKRISVQLDGSSIFNWTGAISGGRWKLAGQWVMKIGGGSYAIQSFLEIEGNSPVGSLSATTMDFKQDHTISLHIGTTAANDTIVETGTVLFIPQGPM